MGYDISLSIDTGAQGLTEVVEIANLTYNVAEIITHALDGAGLYSLNNMPATEALPKVEKALEYMRTHTILLHKYEPANGWGSLDGTIEVFEKLRSELQNHPKTTVEIQ